VHLLLYNGYSSCRNVILKVRILTQKGKEKRKALNQIPLGLAYIYIYIYIYIHNKITNVISPKLRIKLNYSFNSE